MIDPTQIEWVPGAMGDGCGFMAWPHDPEAPEGLWEVLDCEGDTVCLCKRETAVFLHLMLTRFEDAMSDVWRGESYLDQIAEEMVKGNAGAHGTWNELMKACELK